MKIVKKLIEYGVIEELNDWAQHFLAGTKGQPKTDPLIIDYVKQLLEEVYPDQPEKVKNCRLAPWLVSIVRILNPENIDTSQRNKMIDVANWFKQTGTEGPFKDKDLNSAYEFVVAKRAKETRDQPAPENTQQGPYLQAEKDGRIKRIGTVGDGRVWFEVIDGTWLGEPSELNPHHKWGVKCQSESQHGFQSPGMLNVQLVGPPNGNPNGKWSTQLAIAGPRGTGEIKEVKQEGNQQPGSQKTSGGYNDGAQQVVNFLCNNSFARQNFNLFSLYHGGAPLRRNTGNLYGGDAFLIYLSDNKADLFNKLMDCRPDILENNKSLITDLKGREWFEERDLKIDELLAQDPDKYIEKIERLITRWGDEAIKGLNTLDLLDIYRRNPNLIRRSLPSFIGRISADKFIELFKNINLKEYISEYRNEFKELLKFMSNDKAYKGLFEYIINSNPEVLFSGFGLGVNGVRNFVNFAGSPRLREHQDAVWDPVKEEWWRMKKVPKKNENGELIRDENGNRVEVEVKTAIPENLLVMDKKELRKFIEKNKDFIMSMVKTSDIEKTISYLKILLPLMSEQEANKLLDTNNLREKILQHYEDRYNEFRKDEKEKSEEYLLAKYGKRKAGENKILQNFIPGIMEFYRQFKIGDPEKRNIPLEELRKNIKKIQLYYADHSNEKDNEGKKLDGFAKFLELYKKNGAPEEEVIKMIDSVDLGPFLKNPQLGLRFFSKVLMVLDRSKAINKAATLKPFFERLGEKGKNYYDILIENLSTLKYNVNPGDRIMFKGNEGERNKFRLTEGKKYLVIDVSDNYKYDLPEEQKNKIENVEAINGYVLVSEDDQYVTAFYSQPGQNIWVPTDRFEVRSEKVLLSQKLQESFSRFQSSLEKLKKTMNESVVRNKPRYTAVMLDNDSMSKLNTLIGQLKDQGIVGQDWRISADHITMNMGAVKDKLILGQQVNIKIVGIGYDDRVAAVKVTVDKNLDFGGRTPHITLAFNKNAGAKPVMSNEIKEWKPITPMNLSGNIEEVY